MTIFISYARANANAVKELHAGLEAIGHKAFYDGDLFGGQRWWDEILEQIRSCSAFVFALSPESAKSRACLAELEYAEQLGKEVVPLMVEQIDPNDAPASLQSINIQEFIDPDHVQYGRLDQILDAAEENPAPLPDELPPPPPPPMADLSKARELVAKRELAVDDQHRLLAELGKVVLDDDDRDAGRAVLTQLRAHPDIDPGVAKSVDELLIRHRSNRLDRQSMVLLENVIQSLKRSECVPILGTGMTDWLLGTRKSLARQWADEYDFPMNLSRRDDLPQVAQFVSVLHNSRRQLRNLLGSFYHDQLLERFGEIIGDDHGQSLDEMVVQVWSEKTRTVPADPHSVLASLDCKIYVTTEVTSLLSVALTNAGHPPVVDYCRWNQDVRRWPEPDPQYAPEPGYRPSVERPLVYHVFGMLDVPESLVITEDEYFDFLASVAEDHDNELIPESVTTAMSESSLLILGFGLQDWDIRVLLRSLVSREVAAHLEEFGHVAAEVDVDAEVVSRDGARDYLEEYFGRFRKPNIDIFWSDVEGFCADLATAWSKKR